jgi:hypothetical protein
MKVAIAILIALFPLGAFAQKYNVKVIDRKDNETEYTYNVPGHFNSNTDSSANCNGTGNGTNCSGSSSTNATMTAAQQGTYKVRGATLSLQLPDGRVAVVNCESKFALITGHNGDRRNCREPLVNTLDAEFKGDKAKLEWAVSLDGKKKQSETYNVIAIIDDSKNK